MFAVAEDAAKFVETKFFNNWAQNLLYSITWLLMPGLTLRKGCIFVRVVFVLFFNLQSWV
jgi:hypothetical protein